MQRCPPGAWSRWGDRTDAPEKYPAVIFLLWGTGILVENEERCRLFHGAKRGRRAGVAVKKGQSRRWEIREGE